MKTKLFLLGLMAALALPMSAQMAMASKAEAMARNDRSVMDEIIPFKMVDKSVAPTLKQGDGQILWDFESDESFAGWMTYDADGDGYNWEVDDNYSYGGGDYCLTSRSYYGGALTPDNWLFSPQVYLDGTLSLYAMNYLSTWPDKFAVYVYLGDPSLDDEIDFDRFEKISEDITPPTAWTEYTFDLSEYEGQVGCFAIRHYDSPDMFRILIDYITLTGSGMVDPVHAPTTPEALTVEPGTTSANVSWADEDDAAWNLRYRVYNADAAASFFEDFENQGITGDPVAGGWTLINADGDNYNWYIFDPVYSGYESSDGVNMWGNKCATSASYMGAALTPDDWMISPQVTLKGQLSFWACAQDPDWSAEHFAVYVTTGDPADLDSYVPVTEELVSTGTLQQYIVDLSQFEGQQGYVAFRHFNCSDMFRLNIDNVMIGNPAPEWIYVNDIAELNYLIEGLEENTAYEVQVQATNGQKTSNWTESVIFTTLQGGSEPTEKTDAPSSQKANYVYNDGNLYYNAYTVTLVETEPSDIYYRVGVMIDGEYVYGDWMLYTGDLNFDDEGTYMIEAYAIADGKLESDHIWDGFTVSKMVDVEELMAGKTVANVRYFNVTGQEMAQPAGLTIQVTTYTDGTTSAVKVMK
jgi:hypothetical protein